MYKKLMGHPLGWIAASAAVLLTVSPEARNASRRMLVKGTAALMRVGEQMGQQAKQLTDSSREKWGPMFTSAVSNAMNKQDVNQESQQLSKSTLENEHEPMNGEKLNLAEKPKAEPVNVLNDAHIKKQMDKVNSDSIE